MSAEEGHPETTGPVEGSRPGITRNEGRPEITRNDLYRDIGREITARFQVRSRLLFGFAAVSTTLISASLSNPNFSFLDVGVGFLALFAAAMSTHHEIMMAHLRLYQRAMLERANAELSASWQEFQDGTLVREQRMSYWIQLFLYLVLGIAALSAISYPKTDLPALKWIFFGVSEGCFGLSLVCLIYGWKKREKIDLQRPRAI
jgi:hypothetical protein